MNIAWCSLSRATGFLYENFSALPPQKNFVFIIPAVPHQQESLLLPNFVPVICLFSRKALYYFKRC